MRHQQEICLHSLFLFVVLVCLSPCLPTCLSRRVSSCVVALRPSWLETVPCCVSVIVWFLLLLCFLILSFFYCFCSSVLVVVFLVSFFCLSDVSPFFLSFIFSSSPSIFFLCIICFSPFFLLLTSHASLFSVLVQSCRLHFLLSDVCDLHFGSRCRDKNVQMHAKTVAEQDPQTRAEQAGCQSANMLRNGGGCTGAASNA